MWEIIEQQHMQVHEMYKEYTIITFDKNFDDSFPINKVNKLT